jgi:hypothetical protein
MVNAAEIYGLHVRDIRAHFAAEVDALTRLWMRTGMSAQERERRMHGLRAQQAHWIAQEGELYRLNLAHPEGWGSALT